MNVAICDDERVHLQYLGKLLEQNPKVQRIQAFDRIEALYDSIEDGERYDILFMDIDWKGSKDNGIDYAVEVTKRQPMIQIIYVTAYGERFSQHIFLKGTTPCGFLTKPVREEILNQLIDKAEEQIITFEKGKLVVSSKKGTYAYPYEVVLYVESNGHKVIVHTRSGNTEVYEKLNSIEEMLPARLFLRSHKSYLVNMNEIQAIEGHNTVLRSGVVLPISKSQYNSTKEKYFEYLQNCVED